MPVPFWLPAMVACVMMVVSVSSTSTAVQHSLQLELAQQLSTLCKSEMSTNGPFGGISPPQFARERLLRPSYAWWKQPHVILSAVDGDVLDHQEDSTFDWQERGAVTVEVHDQGSLGTCAAFAVTGNIEGQRFLRGDGILETLSVEQIIECSSNSDASSDEANCGVFGGWPNLVLDYVMKRGLATAADWPYCSGTLDPTLSPACFPCMPQGYSREGCDDHDDDFFCDAETTLGQNKRDGWCRAGSSFRPRVYVDETEVFEDLKDEEKLREYLERNGPLAVALNAGPLQLYRRGIFDPPDFLCPRKGRPDHVALLIGYGVEKGKPYWRLKNSWGAHWGEHGYFRMRRGVNACGIGRMQVATALGARVVPYALRKKPLTDVEIQLN